ncbi:uncharacterized protein LOC123905541 [Trifolium pratense]|uniref:uncharacterized protein LOC123905541 n=1 Tax=Trifolium pratense TaxID=57577 RepID=UPI001E692FED|nr:uncharacterized protein LOC123905541 [Trifolium pratense]
MLHYPYTISFQFHYLTFLWFCFPSSSLLSFYFYLNSILLTNINFILQEHLSLLSKKKYMGSFSLPQQIIHKGNIKATTMRRKQEPIFDSGTQTKKTSSDIKMKEQNK